MENVIPPPFYSEDLSDPKLDIYQDLQLETGISDHTLHLIQSMQSIILQLKSELSRTQHDLSNALSIIRNDALSNTPTKVESRTYLNDFSLKTLGLLETFDEKIKSKLLRGSWDGTKLCKFAYSDEIASRIKIVDKLKTLGLVGGEFKDLDSEEIEPISAALQSPSSIVQYLDLSNNNLKNIGTQALSPGINFNSNLQILDLRFNSISYIGAKAIAELLMKNTTLKALFLGNNKIGYEGAKFISASLSQNSTLQFLELSENNIKIKGSLEVLWSIRLNPTLLALDLSSNKIFANEDSEAINEFATLTGRSLAQNSALQLLKLENNGLPTDFATKMSKSDFKRK
ncbi:hypothetical protein HK096_008504, partial [Nowakowskiella sp. JEL0078]